jgi:hypothetical protein
MIVNNKDKIQAKLDAKINLLIILTRPDNIKFITGNDLRYYDNDSHFYEFKYENNLIPASLIDYKICKNRLDGLIQTDDHIVGFYKDESGYTFGICEDVNNNIIEHSRKIEPIIWSKILNRIQTK